MFWAIVLGSSLMAASPEAATPSRDDYEAARVRAGRDPSAHVRLALWCEAHGLSSERLKHLALAVLHDPKNATARGLLGLVAYQGQWQRPDAIADRARNDPALAEYNARRNALKNTADNHWKLALWCDQNNLKPEALAHFTMVVRLDPSREAAWKRLGCKRVGNRWVTEAQLAAEKAELEAQKQADRHWRPLFLKWKSWLDDKTHRARAEEGLATVTDPRAVPSLWLTLAQGTVDHQAKAVQVLGQIDAPGASRALALLAVFGRAPEVRRAATETLRSRDRREYLDTLIALVRDPIKYEVRPVGGPGSPGALFVQGKRFNVQRLYATPPVPFLPSMGNGFLKYDENGLPILSFFGLTSTRESRGQLLSELGNDPATANANLNALGKLTATTRPFNPGRSAYDVLREREVDIPVGRMILEAQKSALVAESQLESDVQNVERYNADVRGSNNRVLPALTTLTGEDLGENQEAWAKWWTNEKGYAITSNDQPTTTIIEAVPLAYIPQPVAPQISDGPIVGLRPTHSCFAAGTPVQTLTGLRPIERIRLGDEVLTQDIATGALSYQPVVAVFHNKPNQTLKVRLGEETVVATGIHRFWKVGRGWTMARDLKPGDLVRTLGGLAPVQSVDSDRVQPVFNLQVAEGESFLVGKQGALVHDNSVVLPVVTPFDAEPSLAVASPGGR
jgi:hypothetical protein